MKLTKASVFRSPHRPPEDAVVILEGVDGWLYLKALVLQEGFITPFQSIAEIETYIGEPLHLDFWFEMDSDGAIKATHYAEKSDPGEL